MNPIFKALLYKYLFYKHFYKFVFLHKPLCERYKFSTMKIFGLYVCRSCLFLYLGAIITCFLAIPKIDIVVLNNFLYLALCGLILTFMASYPPVYSHYHRISKDFVRFFDGVFIALLFIVMFKINIPSGFMSILLFVLVRNRLNKYRTSDRVCKDCPELIEGKTCQGFIQQKEALLKISDEYSQIMENIYKKKGLKKC